MPNNDYASLLEVSQTLEPATDSAIESTLKLVNAMLKTKIGIVSRVENDIYTVEHFYAPETELCRGQQFPLGTTYCAITLEAGDVVSIEDMEHSAHSGHPCYSNFGLETYIGIPLRIGDRIHGTLNFSKPEKRESPWTAEERALVRVLAILVGQVLERRTNRAELRQADSALRESNRKLLEARERLRLFSATLSHDLKEPLRTIRSFTVLLQASAGERLSREEEDFLKYISNGTERLGLLTSGLLDYIKLDGLPSDGEEVDINALLEYVLRDLSKLLQEQGAEVRAGELPTVIGSPWQLQTVFQNLIANAVKFRRPGIPPVVEISGRESEKQIVVEVRDNGIGFADSDVPRMFELFGRLHSPKEYPGTGVGLALVERIMANHGGSVAASSSGDFGSCFKLTFPKN